VNNTIGHFGRNATGGRDLIVGDIHGHFSRLHAALVAVGFDGFKDRLFSVGDLVDRGPESHLALTWLRQPWFHAIRGNHEEAAIAWAAGQMDREHYRRGFSGSWNIQDDPLRWGERAAVFEKLPIGIELETEHGLVGLLHADCPAPSWSLLKQRLAEEDARRGAAGRLVIAPTTAACCWSRDRYKRMFDGPVEGVRAVVVGHEEVERVTSLDNVIFIDTGGWSTGHFTLLDAHTLRPADVASGATLSWEA